MTKAELNRDIKRMYKFQQTKGFLLADLEKEFKRLYFADTMAKDLNITSLKIMVDLNRRWRIIPLNQFYVFIHIDA